MAYEVESCGGAIAGGVINSCDAFRDLVGNEDPPVVLGPEATVTLAKFWVAAGPLNFDRVNFKESLCGGEQELVFGSAPVGEVLQVVEFLDQALTVREDGESELGT